MSRSHAGLASFRVDLRDCGGTCFPVLSSLLQAFLISNRDLELKMSKIQSAQTATTPIASGIVDLRRELDEANQERVQVEPFPSFLYVLL